MQNGVPQGDAATITKQRVFSGEIVVPEDFQGFDVKPPHHFSHKWENLKIDLENNSLNYTVCGSYQLLNLAKY